MRDSNHYNYIIQGGFTLIRMKPVLIPLWNIQKVAKLFCDSEKQLTQSLLGNDLKLFNDMLKTNSEIIGFTEIEKFKLGFRLDIRMMCDCFNYDINEFLKIQNDILSK